MYALGAAPAAPPAPPEVVYVPAPTQVSDATARRVRVGGVLLSGVFAVGGLIASANGNSQASQTLTLLSILSGTVVGVTQILADDW